MILKKNIYNCLCGFFRNKNAMSSDNSEKILECVKFLYDMIKQDKCDMHLNDCEVRTFQIIFF